ncbi:MAG: FAD:protein FMN transferase [Calditrichaeota bacterium]|nr:FAD:protein FMN transferase [Calditrichota bacterium]
MIILKLYKHVLIAFSLICLFNSCESKKAYQISGKTMGTTYHITVISSHQLDTDSFKNKVDSILQQVNMEMSTWIPESDISRFNRLQSTEPVKIPDDFYLVVQTANDVSEMTNGAFDITVSPLIELWGFGRGRQPKTEISKKRLDSISQFIGYKKIELLGNNHIRKTDPRVTINLSAIAKGFGVDKIADFISSFYSTNYLVEIGGEIVVSGLNANADKWQLGIVRPEADLIMNSQVQNIVALSNQAMATSGDYMNFYEMNGKRYSHTIDPSTLKPITHQLASVSVIAKTCMLADAIATGLDVMGRKRAMDWIASHTDYQIYLIERENGKYNEFYSSGFRRLLP